MAETEKSLEIAFPTSWKQKTCCLSRIRIMYFIFYNTLIVCRRGTKPCFLRFSSIVPLRKPLFSVFCLSYPYEALFFVFFTHRRGTKPVFCVFHQSYPYESLFLLFFVDCTPYLSSFSWKSTIYPVSEQFFPKIDNLLSYLSSFSWKSTIYSSIWTVFSENRQFTVVSEQFFPKIYHLGLSNWLWTALWVMIFSR